MMKQAKPSERDSDAVLDFFNDLEEAVEGSHTTKEIGIIVERHWERVGPAWQRVYWAGHVCIQNACDPDLPHLDYKPEIREREAEVERLKAENARLREGIRNWSYCMDVGMRKECPEKVEELAEFLIGLDIAPYSMRS